MEDIKQQLEKAIEARDFSRVSELAQVAKDKALDIEIELDNLGAHGFPLESLKKALDKINIKYR